MYLMRRKAFSFIQSRYCAPCCLQQALTDQACTAAEKLHAFSAVHTSWLSEVWQRKALADKQNRILLLMKDAMFAVDTAP